MEALAIAPRLLARSAYWFPNMRNIHPFFKKPKVQKIDIISFFNASLFLVNFEIRDNKYRSAALCSTTNKSLSHGNHPFCCDYNLLHSQPNQSLADTCNDDCSMLVLGNLYLPKSINANVDSRCIES